MGFANTLYQVKFIVAEQLDVEVIIGNDFLNHHILAILCTGKRISLKDG